MQDIYPGNINTTVSGDPCAWQAWLLDHTVHDVQVGEQVHGLQVSIQSMMHVLNSAYGRQLIGTTSLVSLSKGAAC
jgi:hypothetical protein